MSQIGHAAAAAKDFSSIPRLRVRETLRLLFTDGGGRIDMLSGQRRMFRENGPIVRQFSGPIRFAYLLGPDANNFVLMDRERIFSARRPWTQIMGSIFPNGLLLRDGEEHKRHRRIMYEAFKRPALREYAERMNPMIGAGIDKWHEANGSFLAFHAIKQLTLDMATAIFLGAEVGPQNERMNGAFEDMVAASMSRIRLRIPGFEFHRGLQGRGFMLGMLGKMMPEKKASAGSDMFARLCRAEDESGRGFADQDIFDHMVFLMMAAHDTTTSTLTSMMYELARHPEWQDRVRAESEALGTDEPAYDDIDRLTSLTLVMRESLRRYPPLPVIPRTSTAAFEFGGYRFPANTMVVVSPIFTHHMEEWWEDPFRFDPERFSPARREDERHTHSWIPFGGGPHMCLGKKFAETQVRLIMHKLLLRYRWSVAPGYEMPLQQAPISKPRDGLPIHLEALA